MTVTTTAHRVATRDGWLVEREALLEREKAYTRLGDEIARQRRELPWVRIEEGYRFGTDAGERSLIDLFDGRSQLLVYHFMFGPAYTAGCPVNSSIADSIDGLVPHLHARDATMILVSQAPIEKIQPYKRRMGWTIPWVSSSPSTFNFDFGFSQSEAAAREAVQRVTVPGRDLREGAFPTVVAHNALAAGTDIAGYLTEAPGFSTFVREGDDVYHAYSTTWRGLEFVMGYYPILDRAPLGRAEGDDWQVWIRRHDEYAEG
jgi:predicted dithiol-disulfide oxidoreductase (DUF899 family)